MDTRLHWQRLRSSTKFDDALAVILAVKGQDREGNVWSVPRVEGLPDRVLWQFGNLVDQILAGGHTQEGLFKQVVETIEPQTWSENGGARTILRLKNLLIVFQSRRVHEQIVGLLAVEAAK